MKVMKSQRGMSLIEVMVAVSILSVIMVSVMMLGKNMDKSAKNMEKKGDIQTYVNEISQALSDKSTCSATVLGALAPVNSRTYITSLKTVNTDGNLVAHPRLKISSIASGDSRNYVLINGMYLENTSDLGAGAAYNLVVTFVKNPRAAGGNATSQAQTAMNYVVKKFPITVDNCERSIAWREGTSVTPTCSTGTPVGNAVQVTSSGGTLGPTYQFQVCRNCAVRVPAVGCL